MIQGHRDYREFLREELEERCSFNPRYSLRAFARDLKISPARLSEVLNGKKGLSQKAALALAELLKLSESDSRYFCELVASFHSRSPVAKSVAQAKLRAHWGTGIEHNLQIDAFKVISDWHHLALLQLIPLKRFRSEPAWISRNLGVDIETVRSSLDRLERLNLIRRTKSGKIRARHDLVFSPDGVPSDAVRKFHRQILEKAIHSLTDQDLTERDVTAFLLPVETSRLPEVRERIRKFQKRISEEFGSSAQADHVYSLSMQFFRLTQPTIENY
jgi:uncharacterized protein (TIGR02147 family)